jgi:hypothetical protein
MVFSSKDSKVIVGIADLAASAAISTITHFKMVNDDFLRIHRELLKAF